MSKPFLDRSGDYYYLRQSQKDQNGKWFNRTIASFGKTKPKFNIPFIYRGHADDLIKNLKDKSIDLILTDPPYGLTQNKWDRAPIWKKQAKKYNDILKDNGLIAIFGTVPNIIDVYNGFQEFFDFRYEVIWHKKNFGMWTTDYAPMKNHENIYVFKKKDTPTSETAFDPNRFFSNYNTGTRAIGEKGKPYEIKKGSTSSNYGFTDKDKEIITKSKGYRLPLGFVSEPSIQRNSKEYCGFPTQKPERIMSFFIRGLVGINGIVLDPYLGSGTTAKVAMENARMCIGSEIDSDSYPIIKRRLKQVQKQFDTDWNQGNGFLKKPLESMIGEWV